LRESASDQNSSAIKDTYSWDHSTCCSSFNFSRIIWYTLIVSDPEYI